MDGVIQLSPGDIGLLCFSAKDTKVASTIGLTWLFLFLGLDCRHKTALVGAVNMLRNLAIVLIILWLLGLVSAYTLGGFIHILLVIAVIMILVNFIQGRQVT